MISKDDVQYVANLARVHIAEDQLQNFTKNLEDILGYIEKLNELDLSDTKPTSHVLNQENVYREDEVVPSLSQDDALKIAVEKKDGSFKVPKVIE